MIRDDSLITPCLYCSERPVNAEGQPVPRSRNKDGNVPGGNHGNAVGGPPKKGGTGGLGRVETPVAGTAPAVGGAQANNGGTN